MIPTAFDPDSGRGLPSRTLALRSNLVKAINEPEDRLPTEIDLSDIDLTDRDASIDRLVLEGISFEGGWLTAGWRAE